MKDLYQEFAQELRDFADSCQWDGVKYTLRKAPESYVVAAASDFNLSGPIKADARTIAGERGIQVMQKVKVPE